MLANITKARRSDDRRSCYIGVLLVLASAYKASGGAQPFIDINLLINLIITLIFIAGSGEVALGNTSPGSIMAAVTYASSLLNGIMGLTMISQNISRGMASWRRLSEILGSKPWIENGSGSFWL